MGAFGMQESCMRKSSGTTVALSLLAVIAACATTDTATDTQTDGARATWLPAGAMLVELERSRCDGTVRIDHDSIAGDRRSDLVLREGQNTVFPIDDDDIRWTCVGDSDSDTEVAECPNDASHMRITRPAVGTEDVLFECYGVRRETGGRKARGR
jgi:hypothetical protein